jgi:hypothetical protein
MLGVVFVLTATVANAADEPDLLLIGCQADAVARAAVPFDLTFLEALHFDPVELLAGGQVADLEAALVLQRLELIEEPGGRDGS